MKSSVAVIIYMLIFAMFPFSEASSDWPGAKEGYGPPFVSYNLNRTCGDFIRAKEEKMVGKPENYYIFYFWVKGFISGLNSKLERGGNVLGSSDAKFDDFMIAVENYSRNHPLDIFDNAIGASLKNITAVDWEGKSYSKAK